MPKTLSCDYVFDVLTRQPFPSGGEDDAAVEQHIHACHECRRLAEALRPAVDLLHESIQPSPHSSSAPSISAETNRIVASAALPCYRGSADESRISELMRQINAEAASDHDSVAAATRATELHERQTSRGSLWNVMGLAGLAVGLLLGFGMAQRSDSGLGFGSQDARQSLIQSGTPESCVTAVGLVSDTSADTRGNETLLAAACCTRCHNGTDDGTDSGLSMGITGGDKFGSLSDSCRVCHVQ